ncbi:protein DEPP1 [Protopterus annectens]|uniref:protein DEPP1 n=1 Tax=Protopterus annectens TaxID=7888 RepID=UPI001CF9F0EC|nr:protein DEPP1 [Protopterus annectens]XP_043912694.1 protein DEPP1 [Protopterus annectens]
MRSRLLPFVDHLPAICEDLESNGKDEHQAEPIKENHANPVGSTQSLEEYVKSMRHLVHPTFRPDTGLPSNFLGTNRIKRAQKTGPSSKQPKRVPLTTIPERTVKRHNSLEDITIQFDNQANQSAVTHCMDPFDLLFGHVQAETPEQPTAPSRRESSLEFRKRTVLIQGAKHNQVTKGKANSVCKSLGLKAASSFPYRDTDLTEAIEKRSKLQRFQKCHGTTSRGRAARLLKCTLPIIYEQ